MLTAEFKEKTMGALELPETCIDDILSLADEYEVKCVLQRCEDWLLTELEFKEAKVSPHHISVKSNVKYLMKCLYYGEKYSLEQLYKKSFKMALPYRLKWYKKNEHYQMLLEENKRKLLEARLRGIEINVKPHTKHNLIMLPRAFSDSDTECNDKPDSGSGYDSDPDLYSKLLTGEKT